MKKYIAFLFCLSAFAIGTGCSSLPKRIGPPQSLTFAHTKMKQAREARGRQKSARALLLYKAAYDDFTRLDHIRGKITAALAIARRYFYLDKTGESRKWLDRASRLIENNMPGMDVSRSLLFIEMAFAKNNYQEVIDIAARPSTPGGKENIEAQTEIACYAMAAKARLKQDYRPEFNRVRSLLPRLQKRFERRKMEDPEVLGLAYYYTGYIYSTVEKNWRDALVCFEKAKDIDSLIDNPYGVGKDLYSMGRCYEELVILKKALNCFERSLEVFTLLLDGEMVEKAKKRVGAVREKIR